MVFDLCLIGFVVLFLLIGYAKGFLKFFVDFFGNIVALIAAILLCSPLGMFVCEKTDLTNGLNQSLESWISKLGPAATQPLTANDVTSVADALKQLKFPGFISEALAPTIASAVPEEGTATLASLTAPAITAVIVVIVSFILLFLVFFLLVKCMVLLIKVLLKNKPIRFIDRLVGALFGTSIAIAVILVVTAFMNLFIDMDFMTPVREYLYTSQLGTRLIDSNPVNALFSRLNIDELIQKLTQQISEK